MKSLFVNALLATVPALVALFTTWAVVPIEIGGALGEITNRLVDPGLTVELTARESVELFNVYAPNWLGVAAIAFVPIAILILLLAKQTQRPLALVLLPILAAAHSISFILSIEATRGVGPFLVLASAIWSGWIVISGNRNDETDRQEATSDS